MKKQKLVKTFLQSNNIEFEQNVWLKNYTNFKIGGKAKFMVFPNSVEQMASVLEFVNSNQIKNFVLGAGTNILCCDEGFDGVILNTKRLCGYKVCGTEIVAECGLNLFKLNKICAENSLSGLEFSYGIPGSVGGAIYMNAGISGKGVGDFAKTIKAFDGEKIVLLTKEQMDFGYRHSACKKLGLVVLEVTFSLAKGKRKSITYEQNQLLKKRKNSQPYDMPCAGSVFKRLCDGEIAVSKMIDEMGLKGFSVGGAQISTKHAGFIVNNAQATCKDVLDLVKYIRKKVKSSFGYDLELEIELLGDDNDITGWLSHTYNI